MWSVFNTDVYGGKQLLFYPLMLKIVDSDYAISRLLFGTNFNSLRAVGIIKIIGPREMSSASTGARDRKPTRRTWRKAPTLHPDPNTSVTAGIRVVKMKKCG